MITLKFVGKKSSNKKKIDLPKMTYISKAYNAHAVMQKIAIIQSLPESCFSSNLDCNLLEESGEEKV
jgi:hypothetical protein